MSQACLSQDSGIEEICKNLYHVRVPLPNNPLRSLNSYFILGPDKTTIVDVGFNRAECEQALDDALAKLGRSWESVEIVLTHSHPDHTGNLDRIWRRWMRIYANMHSFQEIKNLMDMQSTVYNPLLSHLVERGSAAALSGSSSIKPDLSGSGTQAEGGRVGGNHGAGATKFKVSAELLPLRSQPNLFYVTDGDVYHNGDYRFDIITTPGHDDWHICLYEPNKKLLISGDHVLERITPTILSWVTSHDALHEFIHSLDKVRDLDVDLILPGHGDVFTGLAQRVDFLKGFHRNRLEELYGLVADGHISIIDIARNASWKHENWDDWTLDQKFYSLGETFAHLIYLVNEGRITMTITQSKRRFYVEDQWDVRPRG